jgi:hypothetical protein
MGYTLQKLWLWHESYLNYFKVLEYFLNKYRIYNNLNLPIFQNFFKYFTKKNTTEIAIDKLLEKFSIKNTVEPKLIKDFINIRNNKDIAHSKIKKQMGNEDTIIRAELFNLSFYDDLWDYWEDIRELNRYLILKYLGLKNIELLYNNDFLEIKLSNH